ncbi:hypothetical protein DBR40_07475 [Pedobacter sp. KBW01]|uniref:DUF262 domain-containing protein n=1 Tax=Pedobacter sp. KBW01 TaxID=2153364 RepID=UPI000F5B6279|nr:DUF262 domain-containing protein [Pedobacter sp. KBW01]RQO77807.1 hypothetical protein DBR40_07475 [Pedobacter sp. KBW01]
MKAINLSELFGQKIFRIPDYQRGYAWEDKQLGELWDDITDIPLGENEYRSHYTGTIYVEDCKPTESENWLTGVSFFSVVDGQQRLTTISILLHVLIKHAGLGYCNESKADLEKAYLYKSNISGESRVYRFCYFPEDKNQPFLLNRIFEYPKAVYDESHYNSYSKNLKVAKDFFEEKIVDMDHATREILFTKVTTALKFDFRAIEKDLDVQAVFETMNNRGKSLSTLEKLKNRLMHLTEKLSSPKEDCKSLRQAINTSWGIIYTWLAKNPDQILDEDVFLSAHLSLFRTPKDAVFSEKLAEDKVFQMFCNRSEQYEMKENGTKEAPVSYIKIQDYIQKLAQFAPRWHEIYNAKLIEINKILLLNGSKEMRIFLTQLIALHESDEQLLDMLDKIERIMFRNRIQGIGLIDERTFATWARELYNGEVEISEIQDRLINLINVEVPAVNMVHFFNYAYGYERGAKGFHRWSTLKYFLFEYEAYLKKRFKETGNKVDLSDYDETTIEHIIPQHYQDNWSTEMEEVTQNLTEQHAYHGTKVMLNTLGNLTILKGGKNASLGNKSWDEKRKRFQSGSYNEIDIAINPVWNRETISKRGADMLGFMVSKIHGLSLTPAEMEQILFSNEDICAAIRDGILYQQPELETEFTNQTESVQ